MIRQFCDQCGKEIEESANRMEFAFKRLTIDVIVAVDKTWNSGHACVACVKDAVAKGTTSPDAPRNKPGPETQTKAGAPEPACPSCKHTISCHMREKHRDWESRYRPHCSSAGCGCGISQEEIQADHDKREH